MKNLKLIGFLVIVVSSLMFIQCTTDTLVGPPGADGIDGINGTNGINGQDGKDGEDGQGTASCVACHSDTHRAPINASYLLSGHAAGGAVGYAGGRSSCTKCHSNEGFIDWMEGRPGVNRTNQTPVSCTTCHEKHSTFDFENDGYDYALRTWDPVTLMTDETVTIDLGDKSNLCANCHQSRRTGPDPTAATFKMTSSHWGPHHGPQANFIEGIQGAELAGSVAYPSPQSATHRTNASCTSCHMAETTDGTNGAHTWIPSDNGCTTCHASVPTEVNGLAADMATLATLLENVVGWEYNILIERDGNGDPVLDDGDFIYLDADGLVVDDPVIELDGNGDPVMIDVHAIVHDGHPNTGFYGEGATFTTVEAQAAWNYLYVMEDASMGIHNPAYARALIQNSIAALQQ